MEPKTRLKSAWRDLPPLGVSAVVLLLLLALMPSALNLPQSNPSQTLEYAPVPPEDLSEPPPTDGDFSSLGLGRSSSLAAPDDDDSPGGAGEDLPGSPSGGAGVGKNPSTKSCVGNPPRQTSDPMSPPCVAFFEGDNGGSTYQGVSRDEVRVIFALEGGICLVGSSRGTECMPTSRCDDLAAPQPEDEPIYARAIRAFQRYFNDHYQTYGRFVHFFACYSSGKSEAEMRRAEAVANYREIKPFAHMTRFIFGNADPYTDVLASKGVMAFDATRMRSAESFRRYPKLLWNYLPSVDVFANQFGSYICQRVAPHRVSFSGPEFQGQPRRYGLLFADDPSFPTYRQFKDRVVSQVRGCGVEFIAESGFASPHTAQSTNFDQASTAMAEFRQKGVTTIVMAGGNNSNYSKAAAAGAYLPEWVVAGDSYQIDGHQPARYQDQAAWEHAWVVTNLVRHGESGVPEPCEEALAESAGADGFPGADRAVACDFYNYIRQLFIGIQVAGPRLSPNTVDKGFRAIPAVESEDPSVPACFYEPGDSTCVKDTVAMWWDPSARNSWGTSGCWRMPRGGQRYLPGRYPPGDVVSDKDPARDPCNGYAGPSS